MDATIINSRLFLVLFFIMASSLTQDLGIADLNDVITSLEKNNFPNDEWDDLGLKLGLIETKLRSIRADNRDVKGCLRDCLRLWLEQDYNREKYDKPTMMSLKNAVEAMGQRAVALGILNEGGEFQPSLEIKKSLRSGSKGIFSTFKEVLKDERIPASIHLLVMGRPGQGKSALVNSIIEAAVAREGAGTENCTVVAQTYKYTDVIPGVNVALTDTPGSYNYENIQQMKNTCNEVSLVLYCMKMSDRHSPDDKATIQKLYQMFGKEFWERVVFVLTFADHVKNEFIPQLSGCELAVRNLLRKFHDQADRVHCIPAGNYRPVSSQHCNHLCLPDRENWLYELLRICYDEIKVKHRFSTFSLSNKINLAVIIDNHGTVNDSARKLSDEAVTLKESFESLGFCVLHFSSLSSQAIATLLQSFKDNVDHSQLSMFALIFLSKGKAPRLYDATGEVVPFKDVFHSFSTNDIPKLFYFELANVDDDKISDLNLPQCPLNSVCLFKTHNKLFSPVSPVASHFKEKLCNTSVQDCFNDICVEYNRLNGVKCTWDGATDSKIFIGTGVMNDLLGSKEKLVRSIWYPIRCKTVDMLVQYNNEVKSTLELATGVPLIIVAAFILFILSIFFSWIATAVVLVPVLTALIFCIASRTRSFRYFQSTYDHIRLDQQLREFSDLFQPNIESLGNILQCQIPLLSHFLKPRNNRQSFGQIEEVLKSVFGFIDKTCHRIDGCHHLAERGQACVSGYGYKIKMPAIKFGTLSTTVHTVFSGPFEFGIAHTPVSAVYDVKIENEQQQAVTIEVEHCVNVSNQSIAKMCFAIATFDWEKKRFIFTPVQDGVFHIGETHGSFVIQGNCLLCVLYKGSLQETSMKYAAHCYYTRKYKNYWVMNIVFTKHLQAHFKYHAQTSGETLDEPKQFVFKNSLKVETFGHKEFNGWIIENPNRVCVTKEQLNSIELNNEDAWKLKRIFPSVRLHIQVLKSDAAEQLNEIINFEGTSLKILCKFDKE